MRHTRAHVKAAVKEDACTVKVNLVTHAHFADTSRGTRTVPSRGAIHDFYNNMPPGFLPYSLPLFLTSFTGYVGMVLLRMSVLQKDKEN